MAQIGIGINENVYIKGASLDPQTNYLTIVWDYTTTEAKSLFDQMKADDVSHDTAIYLKLFPVKVSSKAEHTIEKKRSLAQADLNRTKDVLRHIMKQYMTSDACVLDLFTGTGITTPEEYEEKLTQDAVLLVMHQNMAKQFIQYMQPYLGNKELPMRLLLVRTNKDKHYAKMRDSYVEEAPFLEPMSIVYDPKDATKNQSKLKFTPYEIREGLTNADPVSKDKASDQTGDSAPATAADSVKSVFG